MTPDFWRGRRVFLTGHTGFKGAWLGLWLEMLGADVTGYALPPPTTPSLFELAGVGETMHSLLGDVRDLDKLRRAVSDAEPELLIHMAAQPLVRDSYADPVTTYATNVMGTVHALEAARSARSLRAVLVVTSDKCYQNNEWAWGYRENEPMGGLDPYSNSKGCAELVTSAYRASFFGDRPEGAPALLASARAGNVIGGGDWARDRLLPDAFRSFMDDVPVPIRNPGAIRPWQHVLEPLRGYLMLLERLHAGESRFASGWNFGPDEDGHVPVARVMDALVAQWGGSAAWNDVSGAQVHEATLLKLDSTMASTHLGWRPRWELPIALTRTAEWYRAYADRHLDLRALTQGQIRDYMGDGAE